MTISVLLLDDDPAVRSALAFSLELEGFDVRTFATGRELEQVTDWPEDGCMVVDHRLPRIDALDLIARLRTRGVTLPALLMTTTPTRRLRADAARAGIRIIEKPLLCNELSGSIRAISRTRKEAA